MSSEKTGNGQNTTTAMTPFAPQGLEQAMDLSETLSNSNLLPKHLFKRPADVLVTIMAGHELGLQPMQSIRSIHVVDGKPVLSADLMAALVMRSPVCEWWRLVESTDARAVCETKRRGNPEPTRLSFTIEQARAAGLGGKANWKNYPAAMLRARCVAALARAVYPDLVLGVYEEDELPVPSTHVAPARQAPPRVIDAAWAEAPAPATAAAPHSGPSAESDAMAGLTPEREPGWDDDEPAIPSAKSLSIDLAVAVTLPDMQAMGARVAAAHAAGEITDAERDTLKKQYRAQRDEMGAAPTTNGNGTSAVQP